MKQTAVIKSTADGKTVVRVKRESACDGCHSREFCIGCSKTIETAAINDVGARIGDTVVIEASSPDILLYSMLDFIVPVVLGIAGYIAAEHIGGVTVAAIVSIALFLISFVVMLKLTNLLAGRKTEIHITEITEMASIDAKLNKPGGAFPESGDNK